MSSNGLINGKNEVQMSEISSTASIGIVGTGDANGVSSGASLQNDFLKLLVAQMRFQDPLNPLDGADFTAQLAQFSSLEQLQNIGNKLDESVDTDMLLARSINNTLAATLIGKSIRAVNDSFVYDGSQSPELRFDLSDRASRVNVEVMNQDGVVVRTLTAYNIDAGDGSIVWNGKDSSGSTVPEGTYYVRLSATDANGDQVDVQPLTIGTVSGVRFIDGNPVLLVDGREIAFGSVVEILDEGESNGDNTWDWVNELIKGGN
jgi:flagellar basal-body rod modification protein FlgD